MACLRHATQVSIDLLRFRNLFSQEQALSARWLGPTALKAICDDAVHALTPPKPRPLPPPLDQDVTDELAALQALVAEDGSENRTPITVSLRPSAPNFSKPVILGTVSQFSTRHELTSKHGVKFGLTHMDIKNLVNELQKAISSKAVGAYVDKAGAVKPMAKALLVKQREQKTASGQLRNRCP